MTLGEFLRAAGHTVDVAADADSAERRLAAGPLDVVVADIRLPKASGIDLLHLIRQTAPRVQVILMTALPTVETAFEAVSGGAFDYLQKPICREAIVRSVGNAAKVKAVDDERERLAEENRRYQDNLGVLVRERTAALESAMEELKAAQEQVIRQERLKALGQMVSGIAHDFNSVLMPILGLPEFFLAKPERLERRDEVRRAFEEILGAARDARELVRRLREFYRPTDILDVQSVDLRDLVRTALTLTEPAWRAQAQARGKTIRVETEAPSEPVMVAANPAGVREMLTNLILNAVDAIPESGTVTIRLAPTAEGACLEVRDTGSGMSEETRRRCFEPFYSTKGEHGTGLGLAICYGLVQRHGGRIEVDSAEGRGTAFFIYLSRQPAGVAAFSAPAEAPAPPAGERLHVLVLDDDPKSRALVQLFLSAEGHTVDLAKQAAEALRMLEAGNYDLVLTDRAMPGMSGDEVAREVKARRPDVPVIMLTGFADLMRVNGERPEHVDLILAKPVTPVDLMRAVREVRDGRERV